MFAMVFHSILIHVFKFSFQSLQKYIYFVYINNNLKKIIIEINKNTKKEINSC